MAFIEQAIEAAIKTAFDSDSTLVIDANTTAAFRSFWTDDVTDQEDEPVSLPMVAVAAGPNTEYDAMKGMPMRQVDVMVMIATDITDDPKRTQLATLYENVRDVFETTTFSPSTGTFNSCQVTDAATPYIDGNMNVVEMTVRFDVCTSYS
jgi:hypothetical protein